MDEKPADLLGWMIAGVATVVSALTSALAYVYRKRDADQESRHQENLARIEDLEVKSQKCDDDRKELYGKCERLEGRLEEIEKRLKQ